MINTFKGFNSFINENNNINESLTFNYKGINFKLILSIKDNYIWVQAIPISSKDLDKISEINLLGNEIGKLISNFVKKVTKLNGQYDSFHPGAGYWIKIDQYELKKLF